VCRYAYVIRGKSDPSTCLTLGARVSEKTRDGLRQLLRVEWLRQDGTGQVAIEAGRSAARHKEHRSAGPPLVDYPSETRPVHGIHTQIGNHDRRRRTEGAQEVESRESPRSSLDDVAGVAKGALQQPTHERLVIYDEHKRGSMEARSSHSPPLVIGKPQIYLPLYMPLGAKPAMP
jgi:hypothetical protein